MALKMLRDRTHRLAPQVRYLSADKAAASRVRDAGLAWRAWYKTARWQAMRDRVLLAADLTCARCGWQHEKRAELVLLKRHEADGAFRMPRDGALVADHVRPHRGSEALFWNEGNLQCLCKHCHDGAKQRDERAGAAG